MVPYNVAFRRNDRERDLIIFDMVIELFFIMDIVVHFRTSFVDLSGRIIYDQKKIAVHYLKGWFILDFLAALPFEALYFINQSWVSILYLMLRPQAAQTHTFVWKFNSYISGGRNMSKKSLLYVRRIPFDAYFSQLILCDLGLLCNSGELVKLLQANVSV